MRCSAPSISELRLQRVHRWILLWLKWFAAFLDEAHAFAPFTAQATKAAHRWLDHVEYALVRVIVIRAAQRVRVIRRPWSTGHTRRQSQRLRAVIGGALRRDLRPKDLRQRIAALAQAIQPLVARVAKRLPRGLTRRLPRLTRPEARVPMCVIGPRDLPCLADTS